MSRFNCNFPVPILILGDAPDLPNGLGRIGHDLAWLLSSMPEFRVGYLGRGSFGRAKYPWTSYHFEVGEQWGEQRIEEAWTDLSQGKRGVIFTVWDASRLLWFTHNVDRRLADFMGRGGFERWGYFMADGAGVDPMRLPLEQAEVMARYDRVCLASKWAHGLATNSIEKHQDIDWLPHPINRATFKPTDRLYFRSLLEIGRSEKLIGCVMSNQARKHWSTVIEAVAMLGDKVRLWIHTERMLSEWNMDALLVEYGLAGRTLCEISPLTDRELAMRYAGCDCTVVISGGEGFCYPVAESLSCGVPVVTGSYGAQAELGPVLVDPDLQRVETSHNVRRSYYKPLKVAQTIAQVLDGETSREDIVGKVEHLDMPKLGKVWKKWFLRGLE